MTSSLELKVIDAINSFKVLEKTFASDKQAIAFTGGKDSTVVLELVKMTFGNIPWDVFYIDSKMDHKETTDFITETRKRLDFKLIKIAHSPTMKKIARSKSRDDRAMLARILKIETIKMLIKMGYEVLITVIRKDEHESRSDESTFSHRKDHLRVHPVLNFTEKDIWDFIRKNKVVYNPLYDRGYRSLGEEEFTEKVDDPKAPERAGRDQEKEKLMKRLRVLGYF